ncbi:hypothetical protein [Allokutzneria oryzae]|uniref:Secreted protein n=1 Tax=Allokutzneria oryzae TaxID=1378989 RepID=A0ABV5ZVL8_9PSEU
MSDRSRFLAFVFLAVYVTLHLSVCCGHPDGTSHSAPVVAADHVSHGHSHDLPCDPHAHSADDVACSAPPRAKSDLPPLTDAAVVLPFLGLVVPPTAVRRRRNHPRSTVHSGRTLLLTICVARN